LPVGNKIRHVFVGLTSLNLEKSKVVDKDGNPIFVSAMLNYTVEDPVKFTYTVDNPKTFIENQACAVLKDIASNYSYSELKNETEIFTSSSVKKIQEYVNICGIKIERLNITDLSYAPEIAQQMLVKQQALAHIEARTTIVNSAISIIDDVLEKLKKHYLEKSTKEQIVVNLMTVLSSNSGAQNVVNLN
jgi:regulator of protease activity HflC (stomatin/prohibitin superfamily)